MAQDDRVQLVEEIASAFPAEYEPADSNWNVVTPESATILGMGGSSVVLRALYRKRLRRALKIFLPRTDLRAQLDMSHFLASYENELVRQASLSHQNVSKITDFSTIELLNEEYPFIATEFIDGVDLFTYARTPKVSGEDVFRALKDCLRGLAYLHANHVMHCDLKPENVLVRLGDDPSAIIVDLGSSKNFPPIEGDTSGEEELIYLFTTTEYVPSGLRLIVSNWTNNRLRRSDLRKYFPYQDLHAFGVMLSKFLKDDAVRPKVAQVVGGGNWDAIEALKARLRNPRPGGKYFQSAEEVSNGLDRVGKYSLSVMRIPELSLAPERGAVIPGKGGRIHSTGRVDRIMSHPLFQRFHNLPQLDLLFWTLPGATQTRYIHAAHAYDLMRESIGHLLNNWQVRLEISALDVQAALFPALLNQMGHYHFLHMFEDFIDARDFDPSVRTANIRDDEEILDDVLGDQTTELGAYLGGITDERGRTLPDVVESLGLVWSEVRERQRHPKTPLQGLLAALLSGPLDVEKLAYLRDDSRAAGLQFGVGLEASPIFESLVVPDESDWLRDGGAAKIALGVTERAMSYLEHGILTRYWNIQTAYWHRTNRAVQSMLKFQIASLIQAGLFDFDSYIKDTLHMGSDGALRWLNTRYEYAQDDGAIDPLAVNPMKDLLESRRVIYRRLLTISGKSVISGRDPDHVIFSRTRAQSPLADETLHRTIREALEEVHNNLKIRPGEILIDLPRVSRDTSAANVLVYTDEDHKYMGELFKISSNLQLHQSSFDQYVKRMRVYIHPRIYSKLQDNGLTEKAHAASLDALRSLFPPR